MGDLSSHGAVEGMEMEACCITSVLRLMEKRCHRTVQLSLSLSLGKFTSANKAPNQTAQRAQWAKAWVMDAPNCLLDLSLSLCW